MSNSPFSKYSFLFNGCNIEWKDVFYTDKNYGFDELGMIDIWNRQKFLFYKSRNIILDISPQFKSFRLTNLLLNKKSQCFFLDRGKVMQGFWNKKSEFFTKEFAYIHFQKRFMKVNNDVSKYPFILISQNGFTGINTLPESYNDYQKLIKDTDIKDIGYYNKVIKIYWRYYKDTLMRWIQQTTY